MNMRCYHSRQTIALKCDDLTKWRRKHHEALRWGGSLEFVQRHSAKGNVLETERFQNYVTGTCLPHLFFICDHLIGVMGGQGTTWKGLVACIAFHTSRRAASATLTGCC
ncbi:hypothetical protein, unlikely [Trypanosoma congolense IL3000]|uniref:Uncharacterized protein n=1 Tax=Trypanosoma congolense (strain IL3000) TaxID=1068625 RepID=F9W4M1_TRYCI|nr:hypothetical protein, unlikely [Trypanosoma congolense IL3000]